MEKTKDYEMETGVAWGGCRVYGVGLNYLKCHESWGRRK